MEDKNLFKSLCAKFPTGVTVVTTNFMGVKYGLTVNSFSSVSLNPLLISFCLEKKAHSYEAFLKTDNFAINFLAKNQEDISRHFSSKILDKFKDINFKLIGKNALPIIEDVLGYMLLSKYELYEGGDHIIIIGKVENVEIDHEKDALCYYNRKYITNLYNS